MRDDALSGLEWFAALLLAAIASVAGMALVESWRVVRRVFRRRTRPAAAIEPDDVRVGDRIAAVRKDGRTTAVSIVVGPEWVEAARRVVRRGRYWVVGRAIDGEDVRGEADQQRKGKG